MEKSALKPFDGDGYGSSTHWPYYIKYEAKKNGEWCSCWEKDSPEYVIKGYSLENVSFTISCKIKGPECRVQFPQTQAKMIEIFKRMYR